MSKLVTTTSCTITPGVTTYTDVYIAANNFCLYIDRITFSWSAAAAISSNAQLAIGIATGAGGAGYNPFETILPGSNINGGICHLIYKHPYVLTGQPSYNRITAAVVGVANPPAEVFCTLDGYVLL